MYINSISIERESRERESRWRQRERYILNRGRTEGREIEQERAERELRKDL